jgi:hypothetical protein
MVNAQQEWLTAREAGKLLTSLNGFEITDAFVRRLARNGRIEVWPINQQMYLYSRKSVENCKVERKRQKQTA